MTQVTHNDKVTTFYGTAHRDSTTGAKTSKHLRRQHKTVSSPPGCAWFPRAAQKFKAGSICRTCGPFGLLNFSFCLVTGLPHLLSFILLLPYRFVFIKLQVCTFRLRFYKRTVFSAYFYVFRCPSRHVLHLPSRALLLKESPPFAAAKFLFVDSLILTSFFAVLVWSSLPSRTLLQIIAVHFPAAKVLSLALIRPFKLFIDSVCAYLPLALLFSEFRQI